MLAILRLGVGLGSAACSDVALRTALFGFLPSPGMPNSRLRGEVREP